MTSLVKQLERVEQQVKEVLYKIPFAKKLLMIKGISEISLAGILGEAGDLSGFLSRKLSITACGITSS